MKTKEQILEWLDKQSWKGEFYEEAFLGGVAAMSYDKDFINRAFDWTRTKQSLGTWMERDDAYLEWYDSPNNRPQSWEEYCKENPVQETDWFIDDSCQILPIEGNCARDYDTSANIMSREYCEAFVSYMKLMQLRNAWVKDYNDVNMDYRIIASNCKIDVLYCCYYNTGLSFPTQAMADEFAETFKDLLEVAKPLL